ncbi:MAG: FkbM family methyltransferase [Terriglobales bacterium]
MNGSKPFRHFSLKHRIIAWISSHLFDHITYTARHGLIRGMKRKGGLGWLPASVSGSVETREHQFWQSLDLSGKTVYDVGAFHGLLTLFFASRARQVICYEPNQSNRKRLEENVALNHLSNVRVRPTGLGSRRETLRMAFNPLTPGGATVDQRATDHLLRHSSGVRVEDVPVTTLASDIAENQLPAPDFIKIDIEGWEIEALRGARDILQTSHSELFLEMHGETMDEKKRKVAQIVEYIVGLGYQSIVHIETSTPITIANSDVAAQGHLHCRWNIG